jgi:hypothetical protein
MITEVVIDFNWVLAFGGRELDGISLFLPHKNLKSEMYVYEIGFG